MGRYNYLSWYRLKSNQEHLFLKISGKGYLEYQPKTFAEADAYAQETIRETREIHQVLAQDRRGLIVTLDLRECPFEDVNFTFFVKYAFTAANQGGDVERLDVIGAGTWWRFIEAILPQYLRDRIRLIE